MEPIRAFSIHSLTLEGFKCFASPITWTFGRQNVITGHNGQGKSSIADGIAFAVTGVPFFAGTRLDRLYHEGDNALRVVMEFADGDGNAHTLCRRRVKDTMDITFDGMPATQNHLTLLFGERDVFLSILNPLYFIEVLGNDGRNLLERYLPAIPHEEILAQLSEQTRGQLDREDFLSADAFLKNLRAEVKDSEGSITYMEGQRDLLQTQAADGRMLLLTKQDEYQTLAQKMAALEARKTTGFGGQDLTERLSDCYARYEELSKEPPTPAFDPVVDTAIQDAAQKLERRRAETYQSQYADAMAQANANIAHLRGELARQIKIAAGLTPGIQCPMCRQTITEQNLPAVRKEFEDAIVAIRVDGREQTTQLTQLRELDAKAKAVFEQFQTDDVAGLEETLRQLQERQTSLRETAEKETDQRQTDMDVLRSEIQSLELDLENGLLSPDEGEELSALRLQEPELAAEIGAITAQVEQADAQNKDAVIIALREQITEQKKLISAAALYVSKRVELVFQRLQMNRVAFQLYEVAKTTSEVKDVFKFTYEGRPYVSISNSERIRAGLEVSELLKSLTGRNYPVFIDNAESVPVIDNVRPSGQIFVAQVVKGAKLDVRVLDAPAAKAA